MTSKKRSASKKQPPELPVVFLDECIDTSSLALALTQAGARIERHREHYARGIADQDWIGHVAKKGWVILTADSRQRHNQLEVAAIVQARAKEFVIRAKGITGEEMAVVVVKQLKRIGNIARSEPVPFVAHITRSSVRVVEKARSLKQRAK